MEIQRLSLRSTLMMSLLTMSSLASADGELCAIVSDPGESLGAAKQQFAEACPGLTRMDCDPVSGNRWMCSTEKITAMTEVIPIVPQPIPTPSPEPMVPQEPTTPENNLCEAQGATLADAISAYGLSCPGIPRADCDPLENDSWICSSGVIGDTAPGAIVDGGDAVPSDPAEEEPTTAVPSAEEPTTEEPIDGTPGETNGEETDHTYAKNDGPFKNPLKGWNSGWDGDNDHPESSVGFQYIPWKDFEPSDNSFDLSAVENIIDREGSKNRHLILRLYCDWHGNDAQSDCPGWIYTQAGVERLRGSNGRYITDFNDPKYIAQAREAIAALADEYDNDPRLYAVQMGVIGYWGEWHAWGSDFGGGGYDITDATKSSILTAYQANFDNAMIMARYPWREPEQSASGIGFHNDFFVVDNGHSEEFDTAVSAGGQWTTSPIGGEVPPRGGSEANSERANLFSGDTGMNILETGHYSTMKAGAYRVEPGDSNYAGYMRLHKRMGYNYQIDVARFAESVNRSGALSAEVVGTNIGVAPMYFDWDVQFALLDGNDLPVVTEESETNLTTVLPGAMFNFSSDIDLGSVQAGAYRLAVRIVQPGADKPKAATWKLDARNTYILFSNELPVIDGKWSNNQLAGGWSVLGDVNVQ